MSRKTIWLPPSCALATAWRWAGQCWPLEDQFSELKSLSCRDQDWRRGFTTIVMVQMSRQKPCMALSSHWSPQQFSAYSTSVPSLWSQTIPNKHLQQFCRNIYETLGAAFLDATTRNSDRNVPLNLLFNSTRHWDTGSWDSPWLLCWGFWSSFGAALCYSGPLPLSRLWWKATTHRFAHQAGLRSLRPAL